MRRHVEIVVEDLLRKIEEIEKQDLPDIEYVKLKAAANILAQEYNL